MGDEAVNGVNTGVCGGFVGVLWMVGTGGGRMVEESLTNSVGKAWKRRWKMTKKEALAEAEASFFRGLLEGYKRGRFCRDFGIGVTKGVTERGYTWKRKGLQKVEMRGWMEGG